MEPETGSGEFVSTAQSKYTDTCYSYYDYHETSGTQTTTPTLTQLVKWGISSEDTDAFIDPVTYTPTVTPTSQSSSIQSSNVGSEAAGDGAHQYGNFENFDVDASTCDMLLSANEMMPSRFDNLTYNIPHNGLLAESINPEKIYNLYESTTQFDIKPHISGAALATSGDIDIVSGSYYHLAAPIQRIINNISASNPHIYIEEMKPYHSAKPRLPKHRTLETGKRKYVKRMTKEEQIQNGNNLWQFLMRLLMTKPEIISWTGNDLEFKIVNKEEVARLWGQIKNRDRMNFDKFSRALRYYYDKRILIHNPSSRLTYCFMRNPSDPVFCTMLQQAMRTLPPNQNTCSAYCDNGTHQHELQYAKRKQRPNNARHKPK